MAYEAPASVPRVEVADVVPHYFPGLQKDEDAVPPAVKSFRNKIDLYSVVALVSGDDAAKQTVSNRFNRAITALKSAYEGVVGLMGPPSPDRGLWPEADVYAKCALLGGEEATALNKAYQLVCQMPPSDASFVKWANDRCGARMLVTKGFLLSFVVEFVHTADAWKLKADLKNQYLLNDAATADHVLALADRHVAVAGSVMQRQALEGTGVHADARPSAPLALASAAAAIGALSSSPRADVVDLSSSTAVAAPMSQVQLIAMLPEGGARTAAVMQALSQVARADERARGFEEQRLELEHKRKMDLMEHEHNAKIAVQETELDRVRALAKRENEEFAWRRDERCQDVKRRRLADLDEAIDKAPDAPTRETLVSTKMFIEGLPTTSTTLVVSTAHTSTPIGLRQQVMDSSDGNIAFRLAPGTSLVDVEMEKRSPLRGWVQLIHPNLKPTTAEMAKLGRAVSDRKMSMGGADARVRALDGGYAAHSYFVRDLLSEPLCSVIDAWAKRLVKEREEAKKAKALPSAFSGFVAMGRPIP